jgi:hypothetical protein
VRRKNALQLAEAELAAVRSRLSEIDGEFRSLIAKRDSENPFKTVSDISRRLAALEAEREKIKQTRNQLRMTVKPLREEHAAAVAEALAPMRRAAAERFLTALAEITAAARDLDDAAAEILRAGRDEPLFRLPDFSPAETLARRLARVPQ